jgi:phage recombination protein Bet
MTEDTTLMIVDARKSVKEIVANSEVVNALAQTTFQGLAPANIPKALLEGMMRGYTLNDFLVKKIYALPFKNHAQGTQAYSLVTSIADSRSIAMRNGQTGKSAPTYTITEDGKSIESCSVTVWTKNGDERGFTATVFFSEYSTGKNLWASKPKTMIAKVAEMHALRMAFPEELAQHYVEEEFEREVETVGTSSRLAEVENIKKDSKLNMGNHKSDETTYEKDNSQADPEETPDSK